MKRILFAAGLIFSIFFSCKTNGFKNLSRIASPRIFPIKTPVAGNYPQGLFKYPYKPVSLENELFTQTLEWLPHIGKTFAVNTRYTAILTLHPVNKQQTFEGTELAGIMGLPTERVENISTEIIDRSLVIRIEFEKTAGENAKAQIIFSDEFDGESLDKSKWDLCPEWDRQGHSSWRDDMVSLSGGLLHLKFRSDPELGRTKSKDKTAANTWICAGAVRTQKKDRTILFDNNYGYYEARIKFPVVSGTWGAFWLMSPTVWSITDEGIDGTEIDIVETIGNHEGRYNAALNWNGYGKNHKSIGSHDSPRPVNIYDGEFHIFALDWSPSEYVVYVDGKEFWRADGGARFKNSGINQNPNYIKLTVESSGKWNGEVPQDFTEDEMLVDYVRVYNQPQIK